MGRFTLNPKRALLFFVILTVLIFAQAVWWTVFMAQLVDEKVEMARQLGGDSTFVEKIHQQEVRRQIMVGLEGLFFMFTILVGAWLIYRAQTKSEELKFLQQNFLMAITHELKTPLASMKIYIDSLKSDKLSAERKQQVIPRMEQDVDRLETMVQNVLEAGRFEKSGYVIEPHLIDLSQLCQSEIDRFKSTAIARNIEITLNIESEAIVMADAAAIGRIVRAVLDNAVRYNDKETTKLTVNVQKIDSSCRLSIADNGIGLAADQIGRIFDRFYRVEDEINRGSSGTGLGLYLAAEITKAHRGKMWAESGGLGQGTTINLELKRVVKGEKR